MKVVKKLSDAGIDAWLVVNDEKVPIFQKDEDPSNVGWVESSLGEVEVRIRDTRKPDPRDPTDTDIRLHVDGEWVDDTLIHNEDELHRSKPSDPSREHAFTGRLCSKTKERRIRFMNTVFEESGTAGVVNSELGTIAVYAIAGYIGGEKEGEYAPRDNLSPPRPKSKDLLHQAVLSEPVEIKEPESIRMRHFEPEEAADGFDLCFALMTFCYRPRGVLRKKGFPVPPSPPPSPRASPSPELVDEEDLKRRVQLYEKKKRKFQEDKDELARQKVKLEEEGKALYGVGGVHKGKGEEKPTVSWKGKGLEREVIVLDDD